MGSCLGCYRFGLHKRPRLPNEGPYVFYVNDCKVELNVEAYAECRHLRNTDPTLVWCLRCPDLVNVPQLELDLQRGALFYHPTAELVVLKHLFLELGHFRLATAALLQLEHRL